MDDLQDAVEDSLDSLPAKARRHARRAASATASRFQASINMELNRAIVTF